MTKYQSNIPAARKELLAIANALDMRGQHRIADQIRAVVAEKMVRKTPDKRTRTRHNAPTAHQKAQVRQLRAQTDMSQQQIANEVGLNPGRISEILAGAWD